MTATCLRRPVLVLLVLAGLWLVPGRADEPWPGFHELRRAAEEAGYAGDAERLFELRRRFEGLAARPERATFALYYVGYVDSLLASRCSDGEKRQAKECIEHGIEHVERAVERSPRFAEGHALLGLLYLQKADHSGLGAISLAKKSRRCLERALELEPDNPRAVLMDAVRRFHVPSFLGGSKNKARAGMARSIELFRKLGDRSGDSPIQWGHADAHAWSGIAESRRSQPALALRHYRRALALRPDFKWVQAELLPEVEGELEDE